LEYPGGTGTHLQKNQRKIREQDQEILLQLADRENELRVETSLVPLSPGFSWAWGLLGDWSPILSKTRKKSKPQSG
jgi:hypothetical protein